jgi:hypothetical protein
MEKFSLRSLGRRGVRRSVLCTDRFAGMTFMRAVKLRRCLPRDWRHGTWACRMRTKACALNGGERVDGSERVDGGERVDERVAEADPDAPLLEKAWNKLVRACERAANSTLRSSWHCVSDPAQAPVR